MKKGDLVRISRSHPNHGGLAGVVTYKPALDMTSVQFLLDHYVRAGWVPSKDVAPEIVDNLTDAEVVEYMKWVLSQ